jgi:hypothetical protein
MKVHLIQKINQNLVVGELPDGYKNYPNIKRLALSFTIPRTLFKEAIASHDTLNWGIRMCQVLSEAIQ